MDSPTFADRDAALRQMMGPPTAQQHLHSSMGYPRWDLLPVADSAPKRRSLLWLWIITFSLSIGGSVLIGWWV
jgi:hypothetical protein